MGDKLKSAKDMLSYGGGASPSRAAIIEQANRKRILRERSGIQGNVEVVPNAEMKMPSKKSMMRDSMSSIINFEEPKKKGK